MTTSTQTMQTFQCLVCNYREEVRAESITVAPWHCFSPMLAVAM